MMFCHLPGRMGQGVLFQTATWGCVVLSLLSLVDATQAGAMPGGMLPTEPLEIGHEPQFLFDLYVVDNHWPVNRQHPSVELVFHAPEKHAGNPVFEPGTLSWVQVLRENGKFRMWYQLNTLLPRNLKADAAFVLDPDDPTKLARAYGKNELYARTDIAYAESEDGLTWHRPDLAPLPWRGVAQGQPKNIVYQHPDLPASSYSAPQILDVPAEAKRGYNYLMLYRLKGRGLRIVGSHDGIRWDHESEHVIKPQLHSDTYNNIVYDSARDEYVLYCRAKDKAGLHYQGGGDQWLEDGASRRVARMTSAELWTEWQSTPQTILIPDNADAAAGFNYLYGMSVRRHAGINWGFRYLFKRNTDIYTELNVSRDGVYWQRMPDRPRLLALGDEGEWDRGMIFAGQSWVEVGDEWWIYYNGWDGPHNTMDRRSAVGLATVRKEGFYSLRGPSGGAVVATRSIRWPGGQLVVNADASAGELKVRVMDEKRQPLEGFGYDDCQPFQGDSTGHVVTWRGGTAEQLEGQNVRFDFLLRDADLYTFRADRDAEPGSGADRSAARDRRVRQVGN